MNALSTLRSSGQDDPELEQGRAVCRVMLGQVLANLGRNAEAIHELAQAHGALLQVAPEQADEVKRLLAAIDPGTWS